MKRVKSKVKEYWDKSADIRASLPNIIRPHNVFKEEIEKEFKEEGQKKLEADRDLSFTDKINENLLRYKEIRMVYKKIGISPAYIVYFVIICLIFIFIGFFENYLTQLIATIYPIYISIKTLQNDEYNKDDITQWLTYWVVYTFFINFECLFGGLLQFIPFYFFIKVIFLLLLILPQYNGAAWIYDKLLKNVFNKYENHIYELGIKVVSKITVTKSLIDESLDKKKNSLIK